MLCDHNIRLAATGTKRTREEEEQSAQLSQQLSGMSAQQRMQAKLKARARAQQNVQTVQAAPSSTPVASSTVVTDQPKDDSKIVVEAKIDALALFACDGAWPFQSRCEVCGVMVTSPACITHASTDESTAYVMCMMQELCHDLFHTLWTVRHGAAIGMREIIRLHGAGAGVTETCPRESRQVSMHACGHSIYTPMHRLPTNRGCVMSPFVSSACWLWTDSATFQLTRCAVLVDVTAAIAHITVNLLLR